MPEDSTLFPADLPDPVIEPLPPVVKLGPALVTARAGRKSARASAALTADAVWLQETWRSRKVPLRAVTSVEEIEGSQALRITHAGEPQPLSIRFDEPDQVGVWRENLEARTPVPPDATAVERRVPEGVTLLRGEAVVPHEELGHVECHGDTDADAARGLQLLAGLRGADAVVGTSRRVLGPGAGHLASGNAVRVEDAETRRRLRFRWYDEQVRRLVPWMLVVLILPEVLYLVIMAYGSRKLTFTAPTGEGSAQELQSTAMVLAACFSWPIALVGAQLFGRFPRLLRVTGLAVLGWASCRRLTIVLAHFMAVLNSENPLRDFSLLTLFDPVDWAVILCGVALCSRAWRLARLAKETLPRNPRTDTAGRAFVTSVLGGVTVFLAFGFCIAVWNARYQTTAYLLQPGVDPKREHEAMMAFNEGRRLADQGNFNAAKGQFEVALLLWEALAGPKGAPPTYRLNLSRTVDNLAYVSLAQGRKADAEKYYERFLAMGEHLGTTGEDERAHKLRYREITKLLADLNGEAESKALDEKDAAAVRKYEEAQVKAKQGAPEAVSMFREAIVAWEEVNARATAPEYRKFAVTRLATAYLVLAEALLTHGKASEVEAALLKSIALGEKALAEQPDRPLIKHNLEVARNSLRSLREQAFQEKVNKLLEEERYVEARDAFVSDITEAEKRLLTGEDREYTSKALAHRLSRFSHFLAHCPDKRVLNTQSAVRHARRSTELQPEVGDYWFTLGVAHYRASEWKDSLASLERMKKAEGGYDGFAWLVAAMNRHRLGQRAEARSALKQAVAWLDERRRQSQDNAALRLQFELTRSSFEALKREAEGVVNGKKDSF